MKRINFLIISISILAGMVATGCQKEEAPTVTLGAQIEETIGGAKAYIDGYTPCWHNGDMVYINDAAYPVVAASGSSARIEGVTTSSTYRAIFPARIVTPGIDISSNSSIPVILPSVQRYELVGSHQQVDVPMGAYLTSGSTLRFYNLCSIVRVTVSNSLNQPLPLRHIVLEAENARLSGEGTATVSGDSTNHITMSNTARHAACLGFTADCPVTVPARGSKTFDIVVPAFARDNVTFTVYTTDDYYFEMTKRNVSLWRNCITTVTLNVNSLTQITAAELIHGAGFNYYIPDNTTEIVFEYNNPSVTSGTLLSTTDSPIPIYGNLDGTTWRVSTAARMMNANNDCSWMFGGRSDGYIHSPYLEMIEFGEGFNTENVTNMSGMFYRCQNITSLDISHFNTENVTNMYKMFSECNSLTSLDLFGFNTSNVTIMWGMFDGCYWLRSLDISNFNTESVTNMYVMFAHCQHLTSLDLSNFNTSRVTNMGGMFTGCLELTNLDISNFNTSSVTNMSSMFGNCSSLTSLDLSNFNTESVTTMRDMFFACGSLANLNISSFNTRNVTDMYGMFSSCPSLTNINLSNFNTSNVTDMCVMFANCSSLTSLNLSNFNTSSVTDMSNMFYDCSSLTSLNISNFNTESVTDMSGMFYNCNSLTSLNTSNFNTESVTNMSWMFYGCSSLTSLDLSSFNTESVTLMPSMFDGCSSLTSLNISTFNTESVTGMSSMFFGCSALTSLDLSNFNTANVNNMNSMFDYCIRLTSLDLSNFDMRHLGYTENDITYSGKEYMCTSLSTISGYCTITCPEIVENAIKEQDSDGNYITNLPTSGVTFTWVRPSSK